ncbi:hypothetical protein BLNAU_8902 [Blattamonas nauphoetae]|uniref:RWD domain-containing protein n=1 Tax=Blattamonas nauphoetae TaxID=2049346 RepID=A0ABQ9XXC9_9EUKA|nr:hypothetical protein BLNAU_8902 [Blattamonas nauphoetae]
MSALGIDDELMALSILYPGYRQGSDEDKYKVVEVFNRVKEITYKISFNLEGYPEKPTIVSITDFSSVTEGNVRAIELGANRMAEEMKGEFCICQILDDVQAKFLEIDPMKDVVPEGCAPDACNSCVSTSHCTLNVLDGITEEDIAAVPWQTTKESPSEHNPSIRKTKPSDELKTKLENKKDTFDPKTEIW